MHLPVDDHNKFTRRTLTNRTLKVLMVECRLNSGNIQTNVLQVTFRRPDQGHRHAFNFNYIQCLRTQSIAGLEFTSLKHECSDMCLRCRRSLCSNIFIPICFFCGKNNEWVSRYGNSMDIPWRGGTIPLPWALLRVFSSLKRLHINRFIREDNIYIKWLMLVLFSLHLAGFIQP